MGVENLSYLLREAAPDAILTDQKLKHYSGKIIAMDAFQYLYQSMSSRKRKNKSQESKVRESNTSPIMRTFYSCIKLLENQIKPLYVFDGAPPKLKAPVLRERLQKREEAKVELKEAEEKGIDADQIEYLKTKTVKVGKPEVRNCKDLLKLMGIPYFYAPGEAEAQCAAFIESGVVYASATQDMDALIYGSKVVIRHLPIFSNNSRFRIEEIHLDKVLSRLQLSLPEFIDLSLLMGCDYCHGIKGLGAHRAVELIHKYHTIENILDHLDKNRFLIPKEWLFREAREQFLKPKVIGCDTIMKFTWKEPDVEGILKFLEGENHFNSSVIKRHLKRIPKWNLTT